MSKDKIYQFKVTLHPIKPPLWRRIQIPGCFDFNTFHVAIQDAMGWRQCHSYYFEAWNHKENKKDTIVPYDNISEGEIPDNSVQISNYFVNPNDKMYYEYDMGDSWAHIIVLEKILPENKSMKYPKCLGGRRACPPEDAGGIDEYKYMVEVLKDDKHHDYDYFKSWLKERGYTNFNSEHFDPQDVFKDW